MCQQRILGPCNHYLWKAAFYLVRLSTCQTERRGVPQWHSHFKQIHSIALFTGEIRSDTLNNSRCKGHFQLTCNYGKRFHVTEAYQESRRAIFCSRFVTVIRRKMLARKWQPQTITVLFSLLQLSWQFSPDLNCLIIRFAVWPWKTILECFSD